MFLLVRNKVADPERWKKVFDAQTPAARAAGLEVIHLWQSVDQPDQVFFVFSVEDRSRAEAFMSMPESAQAGQDAGVIDGDFHFLESWPA